MTKLKTLLLAASAGAALAAVPANAAIVDFNATPTGSLAEGTNIGGIVFTTALGGGLSVDNFGDQSNNSQALIVSSDTDGNFLRGAIAGSATALSLDFGNDDGSFSIPGDLAWLNLYSGATLINTVTVALNRDDIMNQTISYSGAAFDNFSFAYTNSAGSPFTGGGGTSIGLQEIVDNINFTPFIGGAVPEPSTWAMMLVGFGFMGFAMRRRQRVAVRYA
jgi:hypothetical protein